MAALTWIAFATLIQIQCAQHPMDDSRDALRYGQIAFRAPDSTGAVRLAVAQFQRREALDDSHAPAQSTCRFLRRQMNEGRETRLRLVQEGSLWRLDGVGDTTSNDAESLSLGAEQVETNS